ncbi:hypothetical protein L5C25_21250 [Pseudomonas aeruginosa]|nr:hypothetical protein [Pseudomonas aeruginosa]
MFKNDTFTRTGSYHQISASVYNLILGAVLLWGFALNWWMVATIPTETIKAINPLVFIIGYFASAIVGCIIIFSSKNPIISFFGYNMIVVPIGLVLVMFIPGHSSHPHVRCGLHGCQSAKRRRPRTVGSLKLSRH